MSPRGGGYCSSASTPSTGGSGSYGTASIANGYGPPPTPANVFNSTSSKYSRQKISNGNNLYFILFSNSLLPMKG